MVWEYGKVSPLPDLHFFQTIYPRLCISPFFAKLFIYLLAALSLHCCKWLSLAAVSGAGAYSLFAGHGLLTVADSLVVGHELLARGLQELWHMGCVALWHVEVSLTRD